MPQLCRLTLEKWVKVYITRIWKMYIENMKNMLKILNVIMKYMYTVHEKNIYWANISQGFVVSNGNLQLVRISCNKLH
jgi:hypothetical protein